MNKYTETKVDKYIIRKHNNGDEEWRLDGKYHREDGPAIKGADGSESWYLNDKLHRKDGPAVKLANVFESWYLNGIVLFKKEYKLAPISYRMNISYE